LRKKEDIDTKIAQYAESTQKTIVASIVAVLSLDKDKAAYKRTYHHWHEKMMILAKASRDIDTSEKTEKEDKNWMEWKDILLTQNELEKKVNGFVNNKMITAHQYEQLIQLLVLSLYTKTQPRRNQDYQHMYVVKKWDKASPTDRNYLDYDNKKFIFNVYKTAKTHGQQVLDIPEDLFDTIKQYLKHHPAHKGSKKFASSFAFLVSADGSALTAVNAITRILNRIFGKNVGASMLRHIFLSNKYDIKEMSKDAEAMGQTVEVQRQYMKGKGTDSGEEVPSILLG
jgi:hypothetical protein